MAIFTLHLDCEELITVLSYLKEHEISGLAWVHSDPLHMLLPFHLGSFFDVEFRYHGPWLCRAAIAITLMIVFHFLQGIFIFAIKLGYGCYVSVNEGRPYSRD